ncbi:hypothetical protein TOPH_03806 [Tolypocladium ophioglossoides CBS 100239]|uniref:Ankyrin repeat protein n=1 Tax=Tolypocladium ophioglossoides (strain CBS 100239) TaxID=1163406 RepID=A0A0L0NCV4_TOLOC|nr:hypothetical protein TOPH_03806 [Tolypocladium ophioglossoides CBS 100239]
MDSNDDSLTSTIVGSVLTPNATPGDNKLETLLRHAGLSPPDPLVQLTRPDDYDFEALVTDEHRATARILLVWARTSDPGYRQPDRQKRHLLRIPSRRSLKLDEGKWTFTKHEVGKAFNALYASNPLPDVRVAQAILSSVENMHSLDELWEHFQDSKLQKRQSSIFHRSTSTINGMANWLGIATEQGNTEYIRLMCQLGIAQALMNHALNVALARRDMDSAHILLSFGAAIVSMNRDLIREYVKRGDIDVVRLLLAAPNGMNVEDWQYCLEAEITATAEGRRVPEVLLQCVDHGSWIASGQLLLKALEAKNAAAVAVLLAYLATWKSMVSTDTACFLSPTGDRIEHEDIAMQACERVSVIPDHQTRYTLYFLLNEAGLLRDGDALRHEMSLSVLERRLPMIRLLISAEVHSSIQAAVARMDFPLLKILAYTKITPEEASRLVSFVPESTSEDDMLRFLNIFADASKSLQGPVLDQKLVHAVTKKHRRVVAALLEMGALITFESAAAIRVALGAMNIEMLQALLQKNISSEQLSPLLPVAMNITDGAIRRQAVRILANKGVKKEALVNALVRAVQSSEPDLELIRIMLKYKIFIHAGSDGPNVFQIAIQQGNIAVIRLLCEASPHAAPLSEAVLLAFSRISEDGDDVTYSIVELLLQHGARGPRLDETLILVAGSDRPRAQDTARLLINHGADANHFQGNAYIAAWASLNYSMLAVLCKACPLQPVSFERLLSTLLIAGNFKAEALELVLESAVSMSAATINAVCTPELLKGSQHLASIIPCFLRHGLDVNLHNGAIPRIAVEERNASLLKLILSSSSLSNSSLGTAFKATHKAKPRHVQLDMMALLLDKARFVEIGQSDALFEETMKALSEGGDQKGLQLLLRHKASVDANGGKALRIAAAMSVSSTAILETLLSYRPNGSAVSKSCLVALASPKLGHPQKEAVLKLLLASKTELKKAEMTELLYNSINQFGDSILLPKMLIARRVKVSFRDLQAALANSNKELFELLVYNFKPDKAMWAFFVHVRMTPMKSDRRLWVYETMLKSRKIPATHVSKALVNTLEDAGLTDIALPKLLLQHGAEVEFKKFLPLKLSFKLKAGTEILELLVKHIKDANAAVAAFQLARTSSALKSASKMHIYRSLLKQNIGKEALSQVLIDTLKDGQDIATMQFLLAQGANPNEDGAKCFALACDAGSGIAFRAMCPYADVDTVTRALLEHCSQEKQVVKWLGMCMETLAPPAARIKDPKLLYEAMLKFPDGGALVEKLLGYGVSAGTLLKWSLCKHWAVESVTPLLWALFQDKKISNSTLLALVARGEEAKPLYLTPKSQVSAAFGCMLDPRRTSVLEALLKQHRRAIITSVIPGRSFSYLSQKPKEPNSADMVNRDLPLGNAALYLGNFEAYRALRCGEDADDGSLHTAALLALPDFVQWLLKRHSADHPLEEFEMMIPLAVACRSKARPWCKVANADGTFEDRQKRTMKLLAQRTNLSWRNRRKTLLHFAIDNGSDTVKAMLKALEVAKDPKRNDRYLYTDREGIVYSLSKYISHLLDPENERSESKKMIRILQDTGKLDDRMYRPQEPGRGVEQPEGYCGMPCELAVKWSLNGDIYDADADSI